MEKERREFGHIYKRKKRDPQSGQVRDLPYWWVRYRVNGKLHRESTESSDRRKAEKLLATRQVEAERGLFVDPIAKRTTFGELASAFIKNYEVNGFHSMRRAYSSVKRLAAFFGATWDRRKGTCTGGCRAVTITTARVREYIAERQASGAANATIQNEVAALSKMLSLAFEDGLLARKPKLPRLSIDNARQGFFEEGDFRALCTHLPEYLVPVVTFAYLTGWRIPSEVLTLRWEQVDFQAKTVRLEPGTTKNREGRSFPFATYPALEAQLTEQRARTSALVAATRENIPWVFHRHGARIKDFRAAWESACLAAGLATRDPETDKVTLSRIPHDFRRTAVRNLERAGVPRSVAMKLTGHKTEAVYRRYAIVAEADLRDGVEKLAALHDGCPAPHSGHTAGHTRTELTSDGPYFGSVPVRESRQDGAS